MQREQKALLETVRAEFRALPTLPPKRKNEGEELSRQRRKREEMQSLLEQIEARINVEGGARTRYASPSSLKTDPIAQAYHDRLVKKIEDLGTQSFPKQDGKPVFGKVTLILSLDARGNISDIKVAESASPFLASYSQKLVRDLAPFEPFPPDMARSTGLLETTLPFDFKRN